MEREYRGFIIDDLKFKKVPEWFPEKALERLSSLPIVSSNPSLNDFLMESIVDGLYIRKEEGDLEIDGE